MITSVPCVFARESSLVEPWSSNCRGRQIFPCRGPRGQVGLFLWLFGELSDQDGWIGQILFIQYGIKKLQSRAGNDICYRKLLTDYFGTFVQVDPPQEQKFLDEMSLSLSEEIHKTHKFRKRKLCFLLLSQPVPHLFLRVSIFLSHCSVIK